MNRNARLTSSGRATRVHRVLPGEAHGLLRRPFWNAETDHGVISDTKTNIRNIEARTANGQANVDVVLDIADLKHLEEIINGVRKVPGVHDVQRLQKI